MNSATKKKLFAKFLAGTTTPNEDNAILKTTEVEQMMIEQWEEGKPASDEFPKPDLNRLLAQVYRRILGRQHIVKKENHRRIPTFRQFAAVAAVLVLLMSVGTILWNEGVILGKNIVTISAPAGVRSEVFLPDGSRVWLNSGSKLTFNKKFDKNTRELKLTGEAFFNISHNPSRPLIVKTDEADIEVLGTRFNVISIPSQQKWEATLVSGSIRVSPSNKKSSKPISLKPGEKALWNKLKQDFDVEQANTFNTIRWVNNQLVFENETFGSLAKQLELTFGVKIIIPSSLANSYRFTATFTDESIFEMAFRFLILIELTPTTSALE
ncbi:MAG: hypothetical protein CVT98_01710 [Bacteroidetes bacterium HGW-Bacteroidetes-15]|nr:MAG: hypothetical protein CVT98_01710 [Bacteroidetes bacterium HGW-Bacteroidetes-15]